MLSQIECLRHQNAWSSAEAYGADSSKALRKAEELQIIATRYRLRVRVSIVEVS